MEKSTISAEEPLSRDSGKSFSMKAPNSRGVIFILCFILFAGCTLFAFNQSPQTDPLQPADLNTFSGWQYPVETNGFRRLHLTGADLRNFYITPDGVHIWIIGHGNMLLHSADKGFSWEKQVLPDKADDELQPPTKPLSFSLSRFSFPDVFSPSRAYAAKAKENYPPKTKSTAAQQKLDAVQQKIPEKKEPTPRLFENTLSGIWFVSPLKGWVTGSRGRIYHTTDGGKNWKLQESGTQMFLASVYFMVDGEKGWAAGQGGTILFTENAGASWNPGAVISTDQRGLTIRVQLPYTLLKKVWFHEGGRHGWAAGTGGAILETNDGGRQWEMKRSNTDKNLQSFWFMENKEIGWAAGDDGILLKTADGGQSWDRVDSGTNRGLNAVRFSADGQNGWIAGDDGIVLLTQNAGGTWRQMQPHENSSPMNGVWFSRSGQSGWIIGSDGYMAGTENGGKTWEKSGLRQFDLSCIAFAPDGKKGWASGTGGVILITEDRGRTWRPSKTPTTKTITDLAFAVDGRSGMAVGKDGVILRTEDHGNSWFFSGRSLELEKSVSFSSVFLSMDGQRVWVSGKSGAILHSFDEGRTWQNQPIKTGFQINDIVFTQDGSRGWAVGEKGSLFITENGGQTWNSSSAVKGETLNAVQFSEDGGMGWTVGDNGVIRRTHDGGRQWEKIEPVTRRNLNSVWFTQKGDRGWAAGDKGTLLYSNDGGQSWRLLEIATDAGLKKIRFSEDGQNGWIAGEGGTLFTSLDNGFKWEDPLTPYGRFPAPWYFAGLLFIAIFLIPAFKKPAAKVASDTSIGDTLASDKPLEAGEPDHLHFGAIARALSMFLRNEKTQPPLTVAVTGDWGAGKSSLMNLLKSDLNLYGFRPVWFNAWHHQREDNILAALIENIISQGTPKWWTPGGWIFRCRLAIIRGWKHWVPLLVILFLCAFLSSYFYKNRPDTIEEIPDRLHAVFKEKRFYKVDDAVVHRLMARPELTDENEQLERLLGMEFENKAHYLEYFQAAFNTSANQEPYAGIKLHQVVKKGNLQKLAIVAGFVLSILAGLRRFLSAFGLNPGDLMVSVSGKFSAKSARAQLGFREKYAKAFKSVTKAFDKRTMVIFIDDLDRCLPDNTLAVLEAINYLVSSGQCFIVIGMDMKRVERCVGLGFRDIAAEMTDERMAAEENNPNPDNNHDEEEKMQRWKFAHQYLEKLINIEVPVPVPDQAQAGKLMLSTSITAKKKTDFFNPVLHFFKTVIPVVVLMAVLVTGFYFGLRNPSEVQVVEIIGARVSPGEPEAGLQVTEEGERAIELSPEPLQSSTGLKDATSFFRPGEAGQASSWLFLWPLGILIVSGIIVFLRRPDVVVKDSARFKSAISVWLPMITSVHNTPRSIKRLKNRLRYFAMRLRSSAYVDQAKGRWRRFSGTSAEKQRGNDAVMGLTEPTIVALGTLHHCNPELLALPTLDPRNLDPIMFEHLEKDVSDAIVAALQNHVDQFQNWPPSEDQLRLFKFISSNINVN